MDDCLKNQLYENGTNYKKALDRIIDKYSKIQYQDGAIEVDLNSTNPQTLGRYMKQSKKELSKLESKSLTDLRDESLRAQDITRDTLLDFTHQDGETDKTLSSTSQFSIENDGMASSYSSYTSQLTELQPEDQDEELNMTLKSHCTLVELYPSMISRIERAQHRTNVSDAADSILRRYHRWRQHSNKSNINNTFVVTQRHGNSREVNSKILLQENTPEKRQFLRTEYAPVSPWQTVLNQQDWKAQHHSPVRERGLWRTKQQQPPILVMDFSVPSETSNPQEISLNETFTVSERARLVEEPYTYSASPSQSWFPTTKAALDQSLQAKRYSLTTHPEQAVGCTVYGPESASVKAKPNIYSSPVRRSPLNSRMSTSFGGSPHSFSRSPQKHCVEKVSTETGRPQSLLTSLSSPLRNPSRMLYLQDSNPSVQQQLPSPRSARAESHVKLRRHLSFDSTQPSFSYYSPKTLDEDFKKLYHKFVCQNKSSLFNVPPCRLCAGNSGTHRGQSSALAALALSPHRSVLRKRSRELSWDSHPQSKRSREEYYTSSPGSKRHVKEVLRHHLSSSELDQYRDDFRFSASKHSLVQKVNTHAAVADTRMSQGRCLSAAEFSGLGGTLKNGVVNNYSPRKL